MIRLFKAALAACLAAVTAAGSADAAQVFISGTTTEVKNNVPGVTSNWSLLVNYTPSATESAPITGADFSINRNGTVYRWNALKVSEQNEIRVASLKKSYTIRVKFSGPAVSPAGATAGGLQADIPVLTVGGGALVSSQVASESNINLLTSTSTVLQGTFDFDTKSPFDFTGALYLDGLQATVIPEPGSIALLSGLGLVAGRRVIARRRQQKANTEPETAA